MSLDATTYRRVIGHFATGVTVISTAVDGRLHGMTANAVTSVSLEPLLLLVCVDREAHANAELHAAGAFAVNILTADQEDVARTFAARREPQRGQLRGVPFDIAPHGSPVLRDCLAYLECRVERHVEAGDHTIFIGRVLDGVVKTTAEPLVFFRSGYWRPGNETPGVE